MKLACALVVIMALPFAALADRPVDVTGVYQSNWGEVRLVQHGKRITGTYVCCGGGTINGELSGDRVMRYRWHQPELDGVGLWRIDGDRLDGTWGTRTVDDGGRWTLTRVPDAQLAN